MLKKIWGILFKKNFGQKHSKIINGFAKASAKAQQLEKDMEDHIQAEKARIDKINAGIEATRVVKAQTSRFSKNLSILIGHEEISSDVSVADASADSESSN